MDPFDHSDLPWLPIPTIHATLPILRPHTGLSPAFRCTLRVISHIRFNHSVELAYWLRNASNGFWKLSISTNGPREEIIPLNKTPTHNLQGSSRITRRFDHLAVVIGHNHYPNFLVRAADAAANEWLRSGKGRRTMDSIYSREPE